jgi:carbonic anhydrase/acetyltransferase-like protein (isoleucine patch superfamily)
LILLRTFNLRGLLEKGSPFFCFLIPTRLRLCYKGSLFLELDVKNFQAVLFQFAFFVFLVFSSFNSWAGDWCIEDPANPPCGGAPGKCTLNLGGIEGGFVARTARVEKTRWLRRNVPFIAPYAQVCERATVTGHARILDHAVLSGNSRVFGNAEVSGTAWVFEEASVTDDARVGGNSRLFERAKVGGNARIFDRARVYGDATVLGNSQISGDAEVFGNAVVNGQHQGCLSFRGFHGVSIYGDAQVGGTAVIGGSSFVTGNACVIEGSFTGHDWIFNQQVYLNLLQN